MSRKPHVPARPDRPPGRPALLTLAALLLAALPIHAADAREIAAGALAAHFDLDLRSPSGLAWDGTSFWISDLVTATICRTSPQGKILERREAPGLAPWGLAWDGAHLWCMDTQTSKAFALDLATWTTVAELELEAGQPRCLAWDGAALWVCGATGERLTRIDPSDGTAFRSVPGPTAGAVRRPELSGLASAGGWLWVADRGSDRLYQVDPGNGAVLNVLPSPGPYPTGLAWDGSQLWCLDYERRRLCALDVAGTAPFSTEAPRRESVTFTESHTNRGPGTIEDLDVFMAVPRDLPNQRLLKPPAFDPKPAEFLLDPWGQSVARFRFDRLGPGEEARVTMSVEVELRRVRWFLDPELAGTLDEVPEDLRARYLADAPKLGLADPSIRAALRDIVGEERNAYRVARKICAAIQDRLRYELSGGWSAAPEVLRRGTGSCSEYTFVMLALCRAAGLPARYQGSIVIRGDDASRDEVFHRWVEVYLPNYGWIPVDPSGGDSPVPEERAKYFGGLDNRYLITTVGGGASPLLGWDYNSRATWTARGRTDLVSRRFGDWAPIEKTYERPEVPQAGGSTCLP